jgi:RNA polymerase sigma-70 factor (ECF subfamily)
MAGAPDREDGHVTSSSFSRMSPELAERFEREALPYRGQLLRVAMQLTRHSQDAEDLVQESITKACAGFSRFTPGTNLKAWLHRILLNTFINSYRKRQREPVINSVPEVEQLHTYAQPGGVPVVSFSAEESVLAQVPTARLVTALGDLPLEFRQVLYLIDVEGFSYRETAAIMNTPMGTVMSRLHRGRSSLRTRLTADDNEHVFEAATQGERKRNRGQEASHAQRNNGSDHSRGDNCHRGDHCLHNGRPSSPSAAAIRP